VRRRIAFVIFTVLPLIVGILWFNFANTNVDEINGYQTQSLILKEAEGSRDALRYNINAAADGYIANDGQDMRAALASLDPGFSEAMGRITTTHAPGMKELGVTLDDYTTIATKVVDVALAPGGSHAAAVKAMINTPAYKEADEQFGLSTAAARLGSSQASDRGNDNWKIMMVVQLAITLFITILVGMFSLMTERAIGRADASEKARKQDRNNLDTEPFTQIVATMGDGVLIISQDNKVLTANPAAQAMLGMRARTDATFEVPPSQQTEIRKSTGDNGVGSVTGIAAQAGGQSVTVVTVREL